MQISQKAWKQIKRIAIGLFFIGLLSQVLTAPKDDDNDVRQPSNSILNNLTEMKITREQDSLPGTIERRERLNINSCSARELQTLPGIGETLARRIIKFRSEYGFHRKEDLMFVKGIGQGRYDKLKDLIAVN